jgi:hypothetical protein
MNKKITEAIYKFILENEDLGVCEEVVIKDYRDPHETLRDAYCVFINRLLESDEGWKVVVEGYDCDDYPSDEIDFTNC